ncbi:MAG: hypothetical protein K0V04_18155 [Deltaproteobacteria bacterium]|nr:hypothetical protein [Deltaproteobacteria bacterium]
MAIENRNSALSTSFHTTGAILLLLTGACDAEESIEPVKSTEFRAQCAKLVVIGEGECGLSGYPVDQPAFDLSAECIRSKNIQQDDIIAFRGPENADLPKPRQVTNIDGTKIETEEATLGELKKVSGSTDDFTNELSENVGGKLKEVLEGVKAEDKDNDGDDDEERRLESSGVTIEDITPSVHLSPDVSLSLTFDKSGFFPTLETFDLNLNGTFKAMVEMDFVATDEQISYKTVLAEPTLYAGLVEIGPIPCEVDTKVEVRAEFTGNFTTSNADSMHVSFGIDTSVNLGPSYTADEGWHFNNTATLTPSHDFAAFAELGFVGKFDVPIELKATFWKAFNMSFSVTPTFDFEVSAGGGGSPTARHAESVKFKPAVGLSMGPLGSFGADFEKSVPETPVWHEF